MPARYFTSRFRYVSSAQIFAGAYVIAYVCLIVAGSLPVFQEILKPLFGSLTAAAPVDGNAAARQSADIGTPAWAALIIMVVAPTVPLVRQVEQSFRLWLQDFSDTPFKARDLADEIIRTMLAASGSQARLEDASEATLLAVFRQLEELQSTLTTSGRSKRDQSYRKFFAEHGEILAKTVDQFRMIEGEVAAMPAPEAAESDEPSPSAPLSRRTHMAILVRRFGRLLTCALLYVESEEYAVRQRLRETSQLSNFTLAAFQFTFAQVVLALLVLTLATFIIGIATAVLIHVIDGVFTPAHLFAEVREWAGRRSLALAFAFVLPMFLVAAIRLYLIDLTLHGRVELGWQNTAMTLLLAFIGCYGLSALPIVALEAYRFGPEFTQHTLAVALCWALPPAIVNAAFVKISDFQWGGSNLRRAFSDFAVFAVLGGAAAVVAMTMVTLMRLQGHADFGGFAPLFRLELAFIVTVTLVSGLNGALQCGASRVVKASAQAGAAGATPAARPPERRRGPLRLGRRNNAAPRQVARSD